MENAEDIVTIIVITPVRVIAMVALTNVLAVVQACVVVVRVLVHTFVVGAVLTVTVWVAVQALVCLLVRHISPFSSGR
jgi:hypothetical protein